jgi:hypothetical protein
MSLNQGNNSNTNQPMAKRPRVSSTPLPSIELQPSTPNNHNNNVTNVRELPKAFEIHKNQQSSDHIPVASSWWPNQRKIIASTTSINDNTGRVKLMLKARIKFLMVFLLEGKEMVIVLVRMLIVIKGMTMSTHMIFGDLNDWFILP